MIDPALYLAFVAATSVLMLIPGPNVALIVANSVAYGTRFGLLTVAGTASAMVLQLAVTALGMAAEFLSVKSPVGPLSDMSMLEVQTRISAMHKVLDSALTPQETLF